MPPRLLHRPSILEPGGRQSAPAGLAPRGTHLSATKNKSIILHSRAQESSRNKLATRRNHHKTAVSNGGGKGNSLCLSSMGPQHHSQTTETPVLYPKKVSAQHHRGVLHHPNGGSPGHRRSNASSH
ncbi:hypothetical protein AVEN_178785-1 [Araneus ventricosus]|uniref:Uncharacterized protein n=1 Tax=Araneus ventricosus TaxID=182803 RepID=A0A4Y2D4Z8_ARAVE|nr:hypothetical protein AVEN_143049-1 [Araneus ventricosus]GBM11881.1 hypothetical protein AVEN_178785-1 [Araneus ventricosus]